MSRIRGRGMGTGMVMGISVVVQSKNGQPKYPSMPTSVMQRMASRKQTELADVVLIARDLETALSFVGSFLWAQIVGAAVESDEYDGPVPNFPVVLGVPELLERVEQDVLVILDADRGLVELDPDGLILAQYQAEHDNIAPKNRIFLDDVHLPALTIDSRTIQVIASVSSETEIEEAMAQGADALYVPYDCFLLPDNSDDEIIRGKIFRLIDLAAGKPLIISDDYALSASILLEAAALADITAAVPPRYDLDGSGLTALKDELVEVENECIEAEMFVNLPRLAADITYDPDKLTSDVLREWANTLALHGAERIVFHQIIKPSDIYFFESLCAAATANTIPVFLETSQFQGDQPHSEIGGLEFQYILGAGAGGFVIAPHIVNEFKQAIRASSLSGCRQEMWSLLKQGNQHQ